MRKKLVRLAAALLLSSATLYGQSNISKQLDYYNIAWESQSKSSAESMPLGGGDVGLNVWVENNELLFYVAQSGTFDENNQMLKHGRIRMQFTPNPFANATRFNQTLRVEEGDIVIEAANGKNEIRINLWVDAFKPLIHVNTESQQPIEVTATYETWRDKDLEMPYNSLSACMSYLDYTEPVTTFKDKIERDRVSVSWYHRNRPDRLVRDFCIAQQGIEKYRDSIPDTQTNRTFGGIMSGSDMRYKRRTRGNYIDTHYVGYALETTKPVTEQNLLIALNVGQYETLDAWKEQLTATQQQGLTDTQAKAKTEAWWKEFWQRSYIFIEPDSQNPTSRPWQVGRNYQLFRYMLGCNATGEYPSKFNGSLFTYDPRGIVDKYSPFNPDFRAWGGGSFTAQNQRLVYWPMLKSGDFDMMPPQFNYYTRTLSAAEARTKLYWGHEGACFVEQLENFGLPYAAGWGFKEEGPRQRHDNVEWGVQDNRWIIYHYINQLEFSFMIMEYYRFAGIDITPYLPFIKSSVRFFDEHYQYYHKKLTGSPLDENGKLVIYPSTAAEMYKVAKNPSDVIAALQTVVTRLSELPQRFVSTQEKAEYLQLLQRIPAIPFDTKEGKQVIKPADEWEYVANQEIPELYPLFPYGVYGLTKPNLNVAKNTWDLGESHHKKSFTECWSQVGIFAARLGLVKDASELILDKMGDAERRFPTFWGPGPDWVPDVDHGGSAMVALQEMLMQTEGDNILLFPAWDKSWNVSFKMYAPQNTVVEVTLKDGEITRLEVTPASRRDDVIIALQ